MAELSSALYYTLQFAYHFIHDEKITIEIETFLTFTASTLPSETFTQAE